MLRRILNVSRLLENPINDRNARAFSLFFAFLVVSVSPASLAEALTEADVIRLARTRDLDAAAAREAVAVAEAERAEATLYPNPSLGWDRENSPIGSSGSENEDSLFVTIPIDLSTRRSARGHLARANASVVHAESARTQSEVVVRALQSFYQIVAERERSAIETGVLERLSEATRVVARRREEGVVAGYDLTRIEIETELAASKLRQTNARIAVLRQELARLLGIDATEETFAGTLDRDAELVVTPLGEPTIANRKSLEFFRDAESATEEALDAASWTWVPSFEITGGERSGFVDQSRDGYVVGISVELPLFSRGQELRAQAEARQRYARARSDSAARAAAIEIERSGQILLAARQEARQFDEAIGDRIERLERAVESGYREGERSIVELLDARRTGTTVALRRLELALSVRHAEIAVRAARGEFE